MDSSTLRLVIFSFVLSILFPVMAYTFTSFGVATPTQFDITLNTTQLEANGIVLIDGLSQNVTFGGAAVEYVVNEKTIRIQWYDSLLTSDFFYHYRQNWLGQILNSWLSPDALGVTVSRSVGILNGFGGLTNGTVLVNYKPTLGWMNYELHEVGLMCFISPATPYGDQLNSSMAAGLVTITVGARGVNATEVLNPQFTDFVNDYMRVVTGQDSTWGMPAFMSWIIRVFAFLTLLAALLLAKEFIPFIN